MTVSDLEDYFSGINLPQTLELYPGTILNDVAHCVDTHINVLKIYGNVRPYECFYDRLMKIKEMVEQEQESSEEE
ncbi:DUF6965 family protein [Pedobacter gandavensis]|uniref:DUF6965 family protein n=1 Tax=Pedobacter gandavensis TaxID=2679963 RepID=UPI00292E2C1F|nr:hypothetical protein [Pedobacter gandavensis]